MNQATCSPSLVHKVFHSLLAGTESPNPSSTSEKNTSELTETPQQQRLTAPPAKNSIRFMEGDQNGRREKYDGCRWRLVCTWNTHECTNIAYSYQLCTKHNSIRRNKEPPKRKRKPLLAHISLPISKNYFLRSLSKFNIFVLVNHHHQKSIYDFDDVDDSDDEDDIQIIEELCKVYKQTSFYLYDSILCDLSRLPKHVIQQKVM